MLQLKKEFCCSQDTEKILIPKLVKIQKSVTCKQFSCFLFAGSDCCLLHPEYKRDNRKTTLKGRKKLEFTIFEQH